MTEKHEKIRKKVDRVLSMSDRFLNDKITLVSFEIMSKSPMFEWVKIAEGVYTMLIEKSENNLTFYVKAQENTILDFHAHDCLERWKLIEGYLKKRITAGIVQPYEMHEFEFLTYSRLVVDFER